jgi:hypothetical protein
MDVYSFILENTNFKSMCICNESRIETLNRELPQQKNEKLVAAIIEGKDVKSIRQLKTLDSAHLVRAVEAGSLSVFKVLFIEKKLASTESNNRSLLLASLSGYAKIVRWLLIDKRTDPSYNQNSAIRFASMKGHTEIVRLLLYSNRIDPAANDNFPITIAAKKGYTKIFRMLLSDPRVRITDQQFSDIWHSEGQKTITGLLLT